MKTFEVFCRTGGAFNSFLMGGKSQSITAQWCVVVALVFCFLCLLYFITSATLFVQENKSMDLARSRRNGCALKTMHHCWIHKWYKCSLSKIFFSCTVKCVHLLNLTPTVYHDEHFILHHDSWWYGAVGYTCDIVCFIILTKAVLYDKVNHFILVICMAFAVAVVLLILPF